MRGAATGKAQLPTVESLTEGTTRRLVLAERSVRRPCSICFKTGIKGHVTWDTCLGDWIHSVLYMNYQGTGSVVSRWVMISVKLFFGYWLQKSTNFLLPEPMLSCLPYCSTTGRSRIYGYGPIYNGRWWSPPEVESFLAIFIQTGAKILAMTSP